jgi:hypothetical protein
MCAIIITAAWEVEVGGQRSKTGMNKSARPYLKIKLKEKGLGKWFK